VRSFDDMEEESYRHSRREAYVYDVAHDDFRRAPALDAQIARRR
jgi:hypothetical protein